MAAAITERERLIYRGKPLIRDGNVLYFEILMTTLLHDSPF